jgi:preprotein translocase subunit SecA
MFGSIARALFGSANDRRVKKYRPIVEKINALEPELALFSDEALRERTIDFRKQLADGIKLEDLLIPAFATVREAAKRALGQRHYDVQLIGGMVLNDGAIAEMKTGEGKTLVGTCAVYLNALTGLGVHVITVNDYLASRDSEWMGRVYSFLGLTTGVIIHGLDDAERKAAYACDITYGTNNEFGFDYLRDNMKYRVEDMVQRGHSYAIVDEVDSILIDEARTPLIISGPLDDRSDFYNTIDKFVPNITKDDFELDEKQRTVSLTESGNEKIEQLLLDAGLIKGSLYDVDNVTTVHHVNQALKAHTLFSKDKDYIVRNDEVVIIDEFTGRMMPGRRYSEGLHQALEAKENVSVQPENQTLASITFQNYFRMYKKLAGMTGTALTEADEFLDIYKLQVVEIPTHMTIARLDEDDEIYRTIEEKYEAIIVEIKKAAEKKQPILVGTTSIEKSETLAEMLSQSGFKQINLEDKNAFQPLYEGKNEKVFAVLNARYHEQEAFIVAQAGVPGAVTIATNMAGRGTDIQLGGNVDMRIKNEPDTDPALIKSQVAELKEKALAAGGMYVIGTERHESRRIDNQLRGRSGRQGDPGRSKFYLSTQDDLMRIFMGDRMEAMLGKLGLKDGEAIMSPIVNRALERAQGKVEARNFDQRKNVLKYDDVANDQRKVIFEQRMDLMERQDLSETVTEMRHATIENLVSKAIPADSYPENWDTAWLEAEVPRIFGLSLPLVDWAKEEGIADEEIKERLLKATDEAFLEKETRFGKDIMQQIEKAVVMQSLDHLWREHIVQLDHLRQVVGLRGYAQKDPLNEFKSEAFTLFEHMLDHLREMTTQQLSFIELAEAPPEPTLPEMHSNFEAVAIERDSDNMETWGKVGRNENCPCGSGKKFKHCHGQVV